MDVKNKQGAILLAPESWLDFKSIKLFLKGMVYMGAYKRLVKNYEF